MLKAIGVIMVAAAAVSYAFYGLILLKQRLYEVRELTRAMLGVRSAVECTQRPVEEVFESFKNGNLSAVFNNFCKGISDKRPADELWSECMDMTPLEKEEKAVFMPFGTCLASADRTAQIKTIDMMTNAAEICEKRLMEKITSYKATEMKIRIMCGIMAAILLI